MKDSRQALGWLSISNGGDGAGVVCSQQRAGGSKTALVYLHVPKLHVISSVGWNAFIQDWMLHWLLKHFGRRRTSRDPVLGLTSGLCGL
jgi:hypothetical protein